MAEKIQLTDINIDGTVYGLGMLPEDLYEELGMSKERFAELLSRDFYCPLLTESPDASTLTYTDTDGSVNHFVRGQFCLAPDGGLYYFYQFMGTEDGVAVWIKHARKVSDLTNDSGFITSANLTHLAVKTDVESELNKKQDVIADLADIRSGAAKGSTALQSYTEKYQGTVEAVGTSNVLDDVNGSRNVKDAKDLESGQLIYFNGHAKATYLSDGRTVEDCVLLQDKETSFLTGRNAVTSVSSIPVTKRLVVAEISSDGTLSMSDVPEGGHEIHILIHNVGSSPIVVGLPVSGGYVNMAGEELSIDPSMWAEVNVISDGSLMYIRGI